MKNIVTLFICSWAYRALGSLIVIAAALFMCYQSYVWYIELLRPIRPVVKEVAPWMPPWAAVINSPGKAPVVKVGDDEQLPPLALKLAIGDYKSLQFTPEWKTKVLITADGRVNYRSEVGGFIFLSEDSIETYVLDKNEIHDTLSIDGVMITKDFQFIVEYEKDWAKALFFYLVGFIVCAIGTGLSAFAILWSSAKLFMWRQRCMAVPKPA